MLKMSKGAPDQCRHDVRCVLLSPCYQCAKRLRDGKSHKRLDFLCLDTTFTTVPIAISDNLSKRFRFSDQSTR